jgi:hypothetical protein
MSGGDDSLLAALVGKELASVIFVRDYVELDFDGPRLSMFVWPVVAMAPTCAAWVIRDTGMLCVR